MQNAEFFYSEGERLREGTRGEGVVEGYDVYELEGLKGGGVGLLLGGT